MIKKNFLNIGNTPLVKLNKFGNNIYAKIESKNPNFSVKCRICMSMILNYEKKNILKKYSKIIEATSGNTGISLSAISNYKKYDLLLTMPDSTNIERQKLLRLLGAKIILTNSKYGIIGSIEEAKKISYLNKNIIYLQQFNNKYNYLIHKKTTGPEIWKDINGEIDVLVAGVGTGGTLTGIGEYIKKIKKKDITIVAIEPENSQIIKSTLLGKKKINKPHKIIGIGAGFIPNNLNLSLIDRVISVNDDEAILTTKMIIKKEGILAGISSGAALAGALKIQKEKKFINKNIVVIFPSSTERYLSNLL